MQNGELVNQILNQSLGPNNYAGSAVPETQQNKLAGLIGFSDKVVKQI